MKKTPENAVALAEPSPEVIDRAMERMEEESDER